MLVQTLLGLLVGAILARLLPPSNFGLLALVIMVIGFAEFFASLGMRPAIARLPKITDSIIKQAHTLALIMGTVFCLVIWLVAPHIAAFFDEPTSEALIKATLVGVWLTSASAASRGLMMRKFEFKWLSATDICAYIIGYATTGISLAVLGFGVWSLVLAHVGSMVIT